MGPPGGSSVKVRLTFAVGALVTLLLLRIAGWLPEHLRAGREPPRSPAGIVVEQIYRPEDVVRSLVAQAISQIRLPFKVDKVRVNPTQGGLQVALTLVALDGSFTSRYPREAVLRAVTTALVAVRGEAEICVCRFLVRFEGVAGLTGRVADFTFDLARARRTAGGTPSAAEILALSRRAWVSPQLY